MINNNELEAIKKQLIELQTQQAFQEDTIQSLDAVVTRQQQQIENLHELSNHQKSQLELISETMGDQGVENRPPHY